MRITCPYCGFSKELQSNQLPAETSKANCPKCQQSFSLFQGMKTESQSATINIEPKTGVAKPCQHPSNIETAAKAGFWLRVVAALIDASIDIVLLFLLGTILILAGLTTFGASEETIGTMAILVILFGCALCFAYDVVFTGHCGQTPGKMALRIKVIRCDGTEISYGRAAFREIPTKFISGIILCIGYLMAAFDAQKQGLHDRKEDTYVIKGLRQIAA